MKRTATRPTQNSSRACKTLLAILRRTCKSLTMPTTNCRFQGCGNHSAYSDGLCPAHHAQRRTRGVLKNLRQRIALPQHCAFAGCECVPLARGYCQSHYAQLKRGGVLKPVKHRTQTLCKFDGCGRVRRSAAGLCAPHAKQQRKGRELTPIKKRGADKRIGGGGYVVLYKPAHPNAHASGYIHEHVAVMSEILGRPLRKGETVHHKNGRRDDNSPRNLELWASSHPPGQRVADLVGWAREILALYGNEVEKFDQVRSVD